MQVSVVIPTYNRAEALVETLAHLAKQVFDHPWQVIVVNNRCTDDTDEILGRQSFPVPLQLVHESTPGAAAARNAGAAAASGDWLIFLDNDILVEPDFVRRHYEAVTTYPGCWIVGQIVNLPAQERTPFGQFRKALSPYIAPEYGVSEARTFTGANVSMPRTDLEHLGGFDESLAIAAEDLDLALRARHAGVQILFDPSIIGLHNDWAGFSIRDYCVRQQLYSRSEPLLWHKYGVDHPRPALVHKNLPTRWQQDCPSLLLQKMVKRLVGRHMVQSALFRVCSVIEQIWPYPPLLWRVYRLLLAAAIYKGFQEGLSIHQLRVDGTQLPRELSA